MERATKKKKTGAAGPTGTTADTLLDFSHIQEYSRSEFQCVVKCDWCTDMISANKKYWFEQKHKVDAENRDEASYPHETNVTIYIPKSAVMNAISSGIKEYVETTWTADKQPDGSITYTDGDSDYQMFNDLNLPGGDGVQLSFTIETELWLPTNESDWLSSENPYLHADVSNKLYTLFHETFGTEHKLEIKHHSFSKEKMSEEEDVTVTFVRKDPMQLNTELSVFTCTLIRW